MRLNECEKETFENYDRAITVLKCKYCGEDITVFTRYVKSTFRKPNEDSKDYAVNCENFKDYICKLDNTKCYLKELHDKGLFFDCNKLI